MKHGGTRTGGIVPLALCLLLSTGCGTFNHFERGEDSEGLPTAPVVGGEVSFASNVKPILSGCAVCHGGGAGGWTYGGGANAYAEVLTVIDREDPAASLLLAKASGAVSHGGGAPLLSSGDSYATVLSWIENGATDN